MSIDERLGFSDRQSRLGLVTFIIDRNGVGIERIRALRREERRNETRLIDTPLRSLIEQLSCRATLYQNTLGTQGKDDEQSNKVMSEMKQEEVNMGTNKKITNEVLRRCRRD